MSNVIQFLEALGQNAAASPADYASAVASIDADAGQKKALLDRDGDSLSRLLQGRAAMRCSVFDPEV